MADVRWSPRAADDFESICEFLGRDSERYARWFAEQVVRVVESIPRHPRLGGMVPEYHRDDLRERLVNKFRIVYRLYGSVVEIVTIVHGARILPSNLID